MSPGHEACFLDTPRLSTLQALLLLLKARESSPKRGYYYRSWMTCKTIVTMAKDMELHEHHEIHTSGESCGSDPVECLTKTRIWQTAFVCEVFIGPPQGESSRKLRKTLLLTSYQAEQIWASILPLLMYRLSLQLPMSTNLKASSHANMPTLSATATTLA